MTVRAKAILFFSLLPIAALLGMFIFGYLAYWRTETYTVIQSKSPAAGYRLSIRSESCVNLLGGQLRFYTISLGSPGWNKPSLQYEFHLPASERLVCFSAKSNPDEYIHWDLPAKYVKCHIAENGFALTIPFPDSLTNGPSVSPETEIAHPRVPGAPDGPEP